MAAITICSDFGAPKIKSATVSTVSASISHEVMGPDAMILVFWMLSFKPPFSLSSFTFHPNRKRSILQGQCSRSPSSQWPGHDSGWVVSVSMLSGCFSKLVHSRQDPNPQTPGDYNRKIPLSLGSSSYTRTSQQWDMACLPLTTSAASCLSLKTRKSNLLCHADG